MHNKEQYCLISTHTVLAHNDISKNIFTSTSVIIISQFIAIFTGTVVGASIVVTILITPSIIILTLINI